MIGAFVQSPPKTRTVHIWTSQMKQEHQKDTNTERKSGSKTHVPEEEEEAITIRGLHGCTQYSYIPNILCERVSHLRKSYMYKLSAK